MLGEHRGAQEMLAAGPQKVLDPTYGPCTCCLLGSGLTQDSHPSFPVVTCVRHFRGTRELRTEAFPSTKPCSSSFALKGGVQPLLQPPCRLNVHLS